MAIQIVKADGSLQEFDERKLLNSLIRSGAEMNDAKEVLKEVAAQIQPNMSTRKIYRLAYKYMKRYNRVTVLRYSLKEALLRLGPSGYPFERYVGALLDERGYDVSTGVVIDGKCVQHEVDVFAENNKEVIIAECKYRNSAEGSHDVKTALYVQARHEDLRVTLRKQYNGKRIRGWLVTNTRFTADAIQFAECSGMKLVSWRYPEKEGLENMIENSSLYPVTVLSDLNKKQVHKLIEKGVFMMKDLAEMSVPDISRLLSLTDGRSESIKKQAEELCKC